MSNIKYNEQEEAFELPYKLWNENMTVRFYTDKEADIIKNLKDIAKKLAKILKLENVYVDIDDEENVVCFDTGTDDDYMQGLAHVELFGELFEITGWVE